ncbi:uncharacterized protein LOC107876600 [Capsicum annuum]|uniref:uncharacterized protein LOC107876600 n=1 Tax=Capsicum annuum TaxID=4072 RepID=UPI0007BEB935|nr:uncharacterized protein LOC107876600 [Capsicum annuum]
MKILMSNKRLVDGETIEVTYTYSAIVSNAMEEKKKDPCAFTIPCTTRIHKFDKTLYDLGTSINLMLYVLYKNLGMGASTSTTMRLLMTDRSIKKSVGVLYDVLVKVYRFILPMNFVVLDYEIDHVMAIILGRPILEIKRVLVDMDHGEMTFWVHSDGVSFRVCKAKKIPSGLQVVSVIDVVDKEEDFRSSQLKFPT